MEIIFIFFASAAGGCLGFAIMRWCGSGSGITANYEVLCSLYRSLGADFNCLHQKFMKLQAENDLLRKKLEPESGKYL